MGSVLKAKGQGPSLKPARLLFFIDMLSYLDTWIGLLENTYVLLVDPLQLALNLDHGSRFGRDEL